MSATIPFNGVIDFIGKSACDTYEAEYRSRTGGTFPHSITVTEDATGTTVFSGTVDSNSVTSIGTIYNFEDNYTASIVDACGQTENLTFIQQPDLNMRSVKATDCSDETSFFIYPSLFGTSSRQNSILVPATLTLTNQMDATDVTVYTITDANNTEVMVNNNDISLGVAYDAVLEDSCNYSINETFTFTNLPSATFEANVIRERGCLDGTTQVELRIRNSGIESINVSINSGPANFISEDGIVTNYSYPRLFEDKGDNRIFIDALPPGNYEAQISNSCGTGNVVWEILPSDTVDHDFTLEFTQGCGTSNSIIINPNIIKASRGSYYNNVNITNLNSGNIVFSEDLSFFTEGVAVNIPNLPAGNYQMDLEFEDQGLCSSATAYTCPCTTRTVMMTIPEYIATSVENIVGYTCTEGSGVVFAEGANGVAPYHYEIIDSSIASNIGRTSEDGIFTGTDEGAYTIRTSDSCGNSADGAFEVVPYLPDLVASCDASGNIVTLMANPVPNATFFWIDDTGTLVQQGSSNELVFDPFDSSQAGEYTLQISAPGLSCTVFDGAITVPDIPCSSSIDVAKTVEFGPIYDNGSDTYTVTYRITAENSGGQAGTYDVTDTFDLGTGITLSGATLAYGGESDGTDGTILSPFNSGDLIIADESLAGLRTESWLVTATFSVDRNLFDPTQDCTNGGGFGNRITVSSDTDPSNNTACVPVEIGNLNISKDGAYMDTNTNGLTDVGDEVVYTFVVTNTGNAALSGIVLSDPLLGGTVAGPTSGDTDGDGQLGTSETWTCTASYAIVQGDIENGQVNNLATVSGEEPDGNVLTGTSTDPTPCTTCTPDPDCPDCTLTELPDTIDISLEKVVDMDVAAIGDEVEFTITARNNGTSIAGNIAISEILPDGLQFIGQSTTLGGYDEPSGIWEIAVLEAGESAELYIRALVVEGTDYVNTAILVGLDQEDVDPSNDEASAGITIEPDCPLIVYNTVSPNNDGTNDFFYIQCIESYPDNHLEIFNRWGVKVFEQDRYDNSWNGTSFGRATIEQDEDLPVGTYFYILRAGNGEKDRAGYLFITR